MSGADHRYASMSAGRRAAPFRSLHAMVAALWLLNGPVVGVGLAAEQADSPPSRASALPGVAAPAAVVQELQTVLALAIQRFEARDVEGVLAYLSDQYRTGPLTKAGIREDLIGIYSVYDQVRSQVRIDEVRMVGEHAWVYSTGEVSGRLPWVGAWVRFLAWQRELEVGRREPGGWRLFGYQQ